MDTTYTGASPIPKGTNGIYSRGFNNVFTDNLSTACCGKLVAMKNCAVELKDKGFLERSKELE